MLKAVLFDFDGTIFHTEHFHHQAIRETVEAYTGEEVDEDELRAYSGLTYAHRLQQMLAMRGIDNDAVLVDLEKKARKRMREITDMNDAMVPGAREYIVGLFEHGIQLAVVTSAEHEPVDTYLRNFNLRDYFTVLTGRDDVQMIKPHPQPYTQTMEQLGVEPGETIAFEDSPPGVESATLAGISVIGLLTTFHAEDLEKTVKTIHDYTEITIEELELFL